MYDWLIDSFRDSDGRVNLWGSLGCGSISGLAFWSAIYPVDFIKTCLQGDSLANPTYRGTVDCFRQNIKRGIGVFYTGYVIMAARAMVVNAVGWVSF